MYIIIFYASLWILRTDKKSLESLRLQLSNIFYFSPCAYKMIVIKMCQWNRVLRYFPNTSPKCRWRVIIILYRKLCFVSMLVVQLTTCVQYGNFVEYTSVICVLVYLHSFFYRNMRFLATGSIKNMNVLNFWGKKCIASMFLFFTW